LYLEPSRDKLIVDASLKFATLEAIETTDLKLLTRPLLLHGC